MERILMFANLKISVLALSLFPLSAFGATISVQPPPMTVNVSDVFTLSITGAAFATPLDAGGLNITWNPGVLALGPNGFALDTTIWTPPSTNGVASPGRID